MDMEVINLAVKAKVHQMIRDVEAISIGEIASVLKMVPPETLVVFDLPGRPYPGDVRSYRGYYNYPAIDESGEECTASMLRDKLEEATSGWTYYGYKGGEYTFARIDPLWVAEWGESSGVLVVGVEVLYNLVILRTKKVE